eukprot:TRINITY_DN11394_c0_g1_i1.p1 TRINITY_DN11394_c0_g1~~TRINITY_DN11394_c0_g1_i1.p1  ORF type:complete len:294 (+),score=79.62 TRINITY_DN11394_c0_g1_i1:3-884(+)
MEAFRRLYPSEFYRKFLVHDIRPDGRALYKIRKTTISVGSVSSADGSAFVKIGNTSMVAGISVELGSVPIPAKGEEMPPDGHVVVNLELLPLCSAKYKPGKPSEDAQVMGEYLNDIAKTLIDFSSIAIKQKSETEQGEQKAKWVWFLNTSIYCINHDGNIFDASLIALIAALKDVKLPVIEFGEDGEVFAGEEKFSLKLLHVPTSLTFGIIDDYILADPTSEEETLFNGTITVISNDKDQFCGLYKTGGTPLSQESLRECMDRAKTRGVHVRSLISKKLDQTDPKQRKNLMSP